jgi:CheY-like chemotaxis protein
MMPDMSGIDVLQAIKSDASMMHIPIIIQSASNDTAEINKALQLGAVSFFHKPYDRQSIISFISHILNHDHR